MPSFNAPRCQHIKTGGTQCGSPALRGQELCHYHRQSRPKDVECYEDWLVAGHSGNITLPVFEDAHSIQFVIRQVTQMILQQKIDSKNAALTLYGLQIASANLKRMETEKPRPTHIVIDLDKVAETPLGMTPWSAKGKGHDPEQEEVESEPAPSGKEFTAPRPDGDPPGTPYSSVAKTPERKQKVAQRKPGNNSDKLPPGTIQACQRVKTAKKTEYNRSPTEGCQSRQYVN